MRRDGFTLIELAAVVAILLVLVVALAPRIQANRSAQFYAEAQALGLSVAQAVQNYLVQDPDRTPATFAADLNLSPTSAPPGRPNGSYFDCSGGGDLNPAVRWAGTASTEIKCVFEPVDSTRFRVYTWWTQDPNRVFIY